MMYKLIGKKSQQAEKIRVDKDKILTGGKMG